MLTGLNHLTLAVSDLPRSLAFYRDVLSLRVEATWDAGAYLSLPGLWLCLSLEAQRTTEPSVDYIITRSASPRQIFRCLCRR